MVKVLCTHCGQTVLVAPDAETCSICGTNLRELIPEEVASDFFYARATELALKQDLPNALAEAQQGAYYANSPSLHLLAAILAERQSKYDLMRRHVSTIPIDDRLRDEGEWLLRSHQERQRAKRMKAANRKGASDARPINALAPKEPHSRGGLFPVLATLLVVIGVGWAVWNGRTDSLLQRIGLLPAIESSTIPTGSTAETDAAPTASGLTPTTGNESAPAERNTATIKPTDTAGSQIETQPVDAAPSDQNSQEEQLNDQNSIDNSPDNLIEEGETPEPIAEVQPEKVADLVNTRPFDILAFLSEVGRNDLAALSVDAQIQDGNLTIVGVVPWAEHRREIIELAQYAPDVVEINAVDLVVRSPDTYKVVEGDTLWIIAYRLYDDAAAWPQIVDANRDVIPAPEALRSGQVLRVPPKN